MVEPDDTRDQRFVTTEAPLHHIERAGLERLRAKWQRDIQDLSREAETNPLARGPLAERRRLLAQLERQLTQR